MRDGHLCPNGHDLYTNPNITVRFLDWVSGGKLLPIAMSKHDTLCNKSHLKEYCDCKWCDKRRNKNADD